MLSASNPTQLIKVNSIVTAVATLKILKLNFFIAFGFYRSFKAPASRNCKYLFNVIKAYAMGFRTIKFTEIREPNKMKSNPDTSDIELFTRTLTLPYFHTSILPYFHSSILVSKFIQKLNHLLTFHDQVAEPVITDAVPELVGKYKLAVLDHRFEVFKGDVGILL